MITTEENCTTGTCKANPRNEAATEATPIPPQTSAPGPRGSKWIDVTFRDYNSASNTPAALREALRDADVQVILQRLEVAHFKHKLEQAEAKNLALVNDVEALREDVERSEKANLELHLSLGQAHKELADKKSTITRQVAKIAHLENKIEALETPIQATQGPTAQTLRLSHIGTSASFDLALLANDLENFALLFELHHGKDARTAGHITQIRWLCRQLRELCHLAPKEKPVALPKSLFHPCPALTDTVSTPTHEVAKLCSIGTDLPDDLNSFCDGLITWDALLRTNHGHSRTTGRITEIIAAARDTLLGLAGELRANKRPDHKTLVNPYGSTEPLEPTPEPQPTEPIGSHNHSVCKGCKHAWRSAAVNPGQNGWCYMFINEPETGHCSQWMPRHDHRKVGV